MSEIRSRLALLAPKIVNEPVPVTVPAKTKQSESLVAIEARRADSYLQPSPEGAYVSV